MTEIPITADLEPKTDVLCDWARANGLDPNSIPVPSTVRIKDERLTVEQYVRDDAGRMVIDPDNENRILRTTRTVPLQAPWPLAVTAGGRVRVAHVQLLEPDDLTRDINDVLYRGKRD